MGWKLFIFFLLSHPKYEDKTKWFPISQYRWKLNRKVIHLIKYLILILCFSCFRHKVFGFFHLNIFDFKLQICVLWYGTNLLCRISGDFVDFELCSKCDWIRFPFCYFLLLFVTFELQIATRWSSKRFKSDWWHNMQFMMDFAWFLLSLFWIHSSLMFCIHWTVFPDENAMDNISNIWLWI